MLLFLAQVQPSLSARPTLVHQETYSGWKNSWRISNGLVDTVIVPQIGRIMRIGCVSMPNLLWESGLAPSKKARKGEWLNWGGDKIWPAPQEKWGWPPEPEYDSEPWNAAPIPNGVRMWTQHRSARLGVSFERLITIKPGARTLNIVNTLKNSTDKPIRFAVWEVCQVNDPDYCLLPVDKTAKDPTGWQVYEGKNASGQFIDSESELRIFRSKVNSFKYGSRSAREYAAAVVKGFRITLETPYLKGAEYPDGGNAEQVYSSGDPAKYCELELNGPVVTIQPGHSTSIAIKVTVGKL